MRRARRALALATVALTAGHVARLLGDPQRGARRRPLAGREHRRRRDDHLPAARAPRSHPGNYHPREAGYGQGADAGSDAAAAAPRPVRAGRAMPRAVRPRRRRATRCRPTRSRRASRCRRPSTASGSANSSGSAAPRGSNMAMLGGTEIEETQHIKVNEEPKFLKYLALPFAVMAAPFKYGADKAAGEPVPGAGGPAQRRPSRGPPSRRRAPTDYETARLQDMERELAQRAAAGRRTRGPPRAGSRAERGRIELRRRARGAARARAVRRPPPRATPAPAPVDRSPPRRRPSPATAERRDRPGRPQRRRPHRPLDHARERRDRARGVRRGLRRPPRSHADLRRRVARGGGDRGGHQLRRPGRRLDRAARRPGGRAPRRRQRRRPGRRLEQLQGAA